MTTRKPGSRWFLACALGAVAPLVLAQIAPGTSGMHEREARRNNPQFQECSKQADEKKLARGAERQAFMKQCLQSKPGAGDSSKSEALREKMREGQSGHLHSDPPPAPAS